MGHVLKFYLQTQSKVEIFSWWFTCYVVLQGGGERGGGRGGRGRARERGVGGRSPCSFSLVVVELTRWCLDHRRRRRRRRRKHFTKFLFMNLAIRSEKMPQNPHNFGKLGMHSGISTEMLYKKIKDFSEIGIFKDEKKRRYSKSPVASPPFHLASSPHQTKLFI